MPVPFVRAEGRDPRANDRTADDREFLEGIKMELRRNLAESHAADSAAEEMKDALSAARERHDNVKKEFGRRVTSLEHELREERKKPHRAPYDPAGAPTDLSRREAIRNAKQAELAKRPGSDDPTTPVMVGGALRNGPRPREAELHPLAIAPVGVRLPHGTATATPVGLGNGSTMPSPQTKKGPHASRESSPSQRVTMPSPGATPKLSNSIKRENQRQQQQPRTASPHGIGLRVEVPNQATEELAPTPPRFPPTPEEKGNLPGPGAYEV